MILMDQRTKKRLFVFHQLWILIMVVLFSFGASFILFELTKMKVVMVGGSILTVLLAGYLTFLFLEAIHVEKNLFRHEELFKAFMTFTPSITFIKDQKGRYIYVNKIFESAFGVSVNKIKNKTDFEIWPEKIAESLRKNDHKVLAMNKSCEITESIPASNGNLQEWMIFKFPIQMQTKNKYVGGVGIDITPRKIYEQRQQILYEVTKGLVEFNSLDEALTKIIQVICGSLYWDMGEIWVVNKNSAGFHFAQGWRQVGCDLPKPDSDGPAFWALSRLEFLKQVRREDRSMWRSHFASESQENYGRSSVFGFPIRNGSEILAVGIFFSQNLQEPDVALLQMFDVIARQIGQFMGRKRLEEQFLQSQKMEGIGRLAGGIAHDFNNLLTVMRGYSDVLLLELKEDDPKHMWISEIKKATQLASNLTRQLLAFSRHQVHQPQIIDLNELLKNFEKMLRRLIREDIEMITIYENKAVAVKADPSHIEQVLINLVVNARDAMPQGGKLIIEIKIVTLDDAYSASQLEIKPGVYASLIVSDTGAGMSKAVQAQIFEPFFTTKEKGQGTGLGLSTVYGIIQQNSGHIRVYSEVDQGTTFKIYLPLLQQQMDVSPQFNERAEIKRGNEAILFVEDHHAIRDLSKISLGELGYKIFEATNGEAALKILQNEQKENISLLVTDIILPGMRGEELAKKIRSVYPQMKVIFTSSYADHSISYDGFEKSSVGFLEKPYSLRSLAMKVREILDR